MKKPGLIVIILMTLVSATLGQKVDEQKLMGLLANAKQYKTEAANLIDKNQFAQAAEAYTKAIQPFLELTNPNEIEASEETVALLYSLRGLSYLGAKDNEKAVADLQKKIDFYFKLTKNNFEKASATPKPGDANSIKLYQTAAFYANQVLKTETNYYSAYQTIFKSMPAKKLIEEGKAKNMVKLFNQIVFDWGTLETEIFLRTNNADNAGKALELLSDHIKELPNDIEGYKLRESIYRKQGKTELANADKSKIKSLQN